METVGRIIKGTIRRRILKLKGISVGIWVNSIVIGIIKE